MPLKRLIPRIAILLVVGTVLGGLTLSVIKHVSFNANPLEMLPENLPEVAGLKIYQMNFSSQHDIIAVLRGDDPDECRAAARSLGENLEELIGKKVKRVSWRMPFVTDAPEQTETRPPPDDGGDPTLEPLPDELDEPAEILNPASGELAAFVWMNQKPEDFRILLDRVAEGSSSEVIKENVRALENAVTAEDMMEAGIVDPTKVTRSALQNAASIASIIMSCW